MHICGGGEYVIIIRLYMWILNQSKDGFFFYLACIIVND